MKFIVTGAAGYLGSTFSWEALKNEHEVLGIDNFLNSTEENITKLASSFKNFRFREGNLASIKNLDAILKKYKPDVVVHFAGLKSVSESEIYPQVYWDNNLNSTINLLESIDCKKTKLIFSSSATVYGDSLNQPVNENTPLDIKSCYGSTKAAQEALISDFSRTKQLHATILRYFNPVGSHEDMAVGENLLTSSGNIMPQILKVALGLEKKLIIYGNDYPTSDGTGERDYIHVSDLIDGHFAAVNNAHDNIFNIFNLGTGKKFSVLQLINIFQEENKVKIDYEYSYRREGDVPISYADCSKANKFLKWSAKRSINQICKDSWSSVKKNNDV